MSFIVAIDGPAGSGKGTVTKLVGDELGLINIDTGATYRCVALETLNKNISIENKEDIINLLDKINIEFKTEKDVQKVYLNGENVTTKIRSKEVSKIVSQVSSIKEVRFKMVDLQRRLAEGKDVIMEGRDIGTYVFPNANVQNQEAKIEMEYDEILQNIKMRDKNDMEKEIGALKKAPDAVYIDSSNLSITQVKDKIIEIIKEKK